MQAHNAEVAYYETGVHHFDIKRSQTIRGLFHIFFGTIEEVTVRRERNGNGY